MCHLGTAVGLFDVIEDNDTSWAVIYISNQPKVRPQLPDQQQLLVKITATKSSPAQQQQVDAVVRALALVR